ncbi:MAG: 3-oxoacyl-ACP reductase [Alphaproteobacteria bacterium]|nr:MAG: 3-oxoacyl-ACP reductase [Alphaproteobacteria bacterium]
MDLGISGRKAIVCASSRGLGKGCALNLARAGCAVIVNGRDEAVTRATAEEIARATGATVTAIAADVSTPEGQAALFAACPAPDILVNNNAGPPRRDYRELSRADILQGVIQNMVTPIELIQKVADGMAARRFGRIVNITSLSVYNAVAGLDLSSGARAGLTAFLAGVARTYASDNVTINNILPGKMDTDRLRSGLSFTAERLDISPDEAMRREIATIPAGRLGTADEFGALCAFLCSVHAGYITGRNFLVDGGLNPSAF